MKTQRMFDRPGLLGTLATAIAVAIFSTAAFADQVKVMLSGDMEVPPVKTMASGGGTITINPDMSVSGTIATTGIDGSMAHIHHGGLGKNGPVLIPLTKTGDTGWSVPPGAKFTDVQYQAYKAGELYINVHSAANKGGEIRGQLTP
jgi:hypothetical protein